MPNSALNFNALPVGLTAIADTVVPPPIVAPPPAPSTILATPIHLQSLLPSLLLPTFVIKQPQPPKPFNGTSSWKSFKEHFERLCRVNIWSVTTDKVLNLILALEGPAAEILKDVNESSPTTYDEIWTLLARRFGQPDAPRDAVRRFDNRRQLDGKIIPAIAVNSGCLSSGTVCCVSG